MTDSTYNRELQALTPVVRTVTRLVDSWRKTAAAAARRKPDGTWITPGDYAAQAILCQAIRADFPNDAIVAEEADPTWLEEDDPFLAMVVEMVRGWEPGAGLGEIRRWIDWGAFRGTADRFWSIDPIDGTEAYVLGGQYAVCVALVEAGIPRAGWLGCPGLPERFQRVSDPLEFFVAARGGPAQAGSLDASAPLAAIEVARLLPTPEESCWAVSRRPGDKWTERPPIPAQWLELDSQAKYAAVACGEVDGSTRIPTQPSRAERTWDHTAGIVIVEQAGGRVGDLDGQPLRAAAAEWLEPHRGLLAVPAPFFEHWQRVVDDATGP